MQFRPYDIITAKRDGRAHTRDEIMFFIDGYTRGDIPDYQVSAWLMACFLNGLNEDETYFLTDAMLHSGSIIDLKTIHKPKVDKHSTGGVGDKISLVLAPAVAACGVAVPMTSGRGLGFSGGTLDKLESIPGFNVNLSEREFVQVLKEVGYVMSGQTQTLAPADRKLYALRDVTGTVENISLITASILSKKVAEGADSIVMDVKSGSGAFMKTLDESRSLSNSLTQTAEKLGKKLTCIISNMGQPLGRAVGNSLEVIESIECLRGKGPDDVVDLVTILGGHMLKHAGFVESVVGGREMIQKKLRSGEALERFIHSVQRQGGAIEVVEDTERFEKAGSEVSVASQEHGYVCSINTEDIGTAAIFIGAGRFTKEDAIDQSAGVTIHKKIGDSVETGEALAKLHFNNRSGLERAIALIQDAYEIGQQEPATFQLVHEVIG
jgi:pyrimidine-nucleoside phosphorylase